MKTKNIIASLVLSLGVISSSTVAYADLNSGKMKADNKEFYCMVSKIKGFWQDGNWASTDDISKSTIFRVGVQLITISNGKPNNSTNVFYDDDNADTGVFNQASHLAKGVHRVLKGSTIYTSSTTLTK